jgi:hypothetical protein
MNGFRCMGYKQCVLLMSRVLMGGLAVYTGNMDVRTSTLHWKFKQNYVLLSWYRNDSLDYDFQELLTMVKKVICVPASFRI